MNYSNTIFNQLLDFLPKHKFHTFVGQHNGDKYYKKLKTWNHFVLLLYAQATKKESLREIETGFSSHQEKYYHLGVKSVARSTLSDANNKRSYKIFEKLFYELLDQCLKITPERGFSFKNPLYSLDSSTIQLCLNLFDWAKYRKTKGALKLHTLLNNRTGIPELINISNGKLADITAAKAMGLNFKKDSILVFDRGYIDYQWWYNFTKKGIFFVSRIKKNQKIYVLGQHKNALNKEKEADLEVVIGGFKAIETYPDNLRLVRIYDSKKQKYYDYLTNNFDLKPHQIKEIYTKRWEIEIFFKWIKQNLKIKSFLGTGKNAVLSQIWIAMIYFLLLQYIKFQTNFKKSLLELTRMIRETLMFRRNLIDLLSLSVKTVDKLKPEKDFQTAFF